MLYLLKSFICLKVRPGNIIARPHLRQYEIVFMADSSLTDDFQITIPVVIQDAGI